jgi:hypothetical protein
MAERRRTERREEERRAARRKLQPTREDILKVAKIFHWKGSMPNWTTIIDGREHPARPLVLKAARASESNPTNAGEAAVILSDLGFEVRFKGETIPSDDLPD